MTQTMMKKPSVTELMKRADEKAANPSSGAYKPTFLLLKEGQKALIRPLYNLIGEQADACVMAMHNKFNVADPKQSINSVCAQEIDKACELCRLAEAGDKQLRPSWSIMLPVYLYRQEELKDGSWEKLTYTDSSGVEQRVCGVRVLELKDFGKIYDVLKFLRSHLRDEKPHDITTCDFSIEQSGSGKQKSFIVKALGAKDMNPKIREHIPSPEQVRQMVIEACKPRVVQTGNAAIDNGIAYDLGELDDDGEIPF